MSLCSMRVSNELGAGNPQTARTYILVASALGVVEVIIISRVDTPSIIVKVVARKAKRRDSLLSFAFLYPAKAIILQEAMEDELNSVSKNHFWGIAELPKGAKPVGCNNEEIQLHQESDDILLASNNIDLLHESKRFLSRNFDMKDLGLALLRRESLMPKVQVETVEAPTELIQGAIDFHPFAEAAYTGPLLDVGRNPLFFLCAWLHRQGVLCPLTRKRLNQISYFYENDLFCISHHLKGKSPTIPISCRLPVLKGDNWWRGHARAFLKYVNLPAEALRQGRVCQTRCEAAYFVLVHHHIKCVVICVRGTETREDLLTDGLSRECMLATEDFDGIIQ
ncbi:hypothetical protein Tco_0785300 [Tanacetum coccineum]